MLTLEPLESRTLLSAGQLDLHFGDLGTAQFQYPVARPTAPSAMATLPDGRTLVVGDYYSSGTTTLALFSPDGTPDPTFADHGIRALPVSLAVSTVLSAPDGSVYLVSRIGGATVARLTPSLTLDPAWGDNGVLTFAFPSNHQLRANAAVLLPDGSLFIAGDLAADIFYTRILPTGQLDPAFPRGFVRFRANRRYTDSLSSLTLLADGTLLASGSSAGDFLLWKITPNGKPVPGFGDADGMVVTDFGPTDDLASSHVVLPDGSIVAAGTSGGRFALARYSPAGKLLRTFGHRGRITLDLDGPVERGARLLLTPQGRLVLVGTTGNYFEHTLRVTAASFQPRGRLDRTFGQRGIQTFNFDPAPDSSTRATAALLDPAGRLLISAAAYSDSTPNQIALFRLTSTGQLDPVFGKAGVTTTAIRLPAYVTANAIARQSDGKIITLASVEVPQSNGTDPRPLLTRFDPDGTVDATFADSGSRLLLQLRIGITPKSILVDADDRIYVAGRDPTTSGRAMILRFTREGHIDPTFGSDGFISISIDADFTHNFSLALQNDHLLVATNNETHWLVYRFQSSGLLDSSFGSFGIARVSSPLTSHPSAFLTSLLVDINDRIVLLGRFYQPHPLYAIGPNRGFVALARLTPAGQLDPSFANAGIQTASITGTDFAASAALLPDGRTAVVCESYEEDSTTSITLLLYRSDGSLDQSFAGTGMTAAPSRDLYHPSVAYVDGRIILGATRYQSLTVRTLLLRYTLDGSLDPDFGNQGQFTVNSSADLQSGPLLLPQPTGNLLLQYSGSQSLFLTQILSDTAPAPTAHIENRILRIRGTSGDDIVLLRRSANQLTLLGSPVSYPLSDFSAIEIEGLAGNDLLDASQSPVPVTLIGGDGDDSLLGGAHPDLLLANAGHDTLFGGKGNDSLHGNAGNDYLNPGPGHDTLFADEGNDQIFARDSQPDLLHGGPGHDRAIHDPADQFQDNESLMT